MVLERGLSNQFPTNQLEKPRKEVEAYGHSLLKIDLLPPWVLEDSNGVCLLGNNDDRASLQHQKSCFGELQLDIHSITKIPKTLGFLNTLKRKKES